MHYYLMEYQTENIAAISEDGIHIIARLYSSSNILEHDKGWDGEPLQHRVASEVSRTGIEFETKSHWTPRLHSKSS